MSNMDVGKEFIEHFGIKGQRWGVRRSARQLSRNSSKTTAKKMSDDELRSVLRRLQMEQQYRALTSKSSPTKIGAAFVGGLALNVARTQLTNVINNQIGKTLKKKG